MARYHGRHGRGARQRAKEYRRAEAVARQQAHVDRGWYEDRRGIRCIPAPVEDFLPRPAEVAA
jgi:hypothetical protein